MTDFMTVLGNLTLAASLAVLLVLAVRVLLARLPKRYLTFLWLPSSSGRCVRFHFSRLSVFTGF